MPMKTRSAWWRCLAAGKSPSSRTDLNGDLHFGPERPRVAKSFDKNGMVMLCSSFSKTLAPGYRVGWTAPGRFFEKVRKLKFTNTLATATLPQLAIAEFVKNGGYDHHLRSIRRTYAGQVQRVSQAVAAHFPAGTRSPGRRAALSCGLNCPAAWMRSCFMSAPLRKISASPRGRCLREKLLQELHPQSVAATPGRPESSAASSLLAPLPGS